MDDTNEPEVLWDPFDKDNNDPPPPDLATYEGRAKHILEACAGSGEPVFILRARDFFAIMAINHYLQVVEEFGPTNLDFQREIVDTLSGFKNWQRANSDKVRFPD